jgi:anti-sigma regulatory factor (Ser/Thr protein kinase)
VDIRARTTLQPVVTAPAAARAFARDACLRAETTDRVEDVALVVSELVTNAILHGLGNVTLDVVVENGGVRIEVGDADPALGRPRAAAANGESGRGLLIVARVAARWGVRRDGPGKVVWADMPG